MEKFVISIIPETNRSNGSLTTMNFVYDLSLISLSSFDKDQKLIPSKFVGSFASRPDAADQLFFSISDFISFPRGKFFSYCSFAL